MYVLTPAHISQEHGDTHDWPAASASEATALRHYTNLIIIIIIIDDVDIGSIWPKIYMHRHNSSANNCRYILKVSWQ